ncbi:hypothetical protein C7B62_23430 [Pleurocapsa sp. CCALA 161]|uniref:hypothetical protein n=1 Tax=Pleurocapsa sp. CCALA 161 TaxID=2107688 RepID=UPI000D06CD66|nr:hypothetical protein [Pleurocapsa sp. CCALA 161]PSB06210.1 hypothetical protein C7B62_23430 [Pleurocapsa sp. CCALA 161]
MINKQLSGLTKASIQKSEEALLKTETAIATLTNRQQKITIRSVAEEAKVSVSYIYKHPELAYKIQRLREQQKYDLIVNHQSRKKANLEAKVRQKEQATIKEKDDLKVIIEQVKKENNLENLQAENLQLAMENLRLKQELKYALKSLQEARAFILEQQQLNS